jgi:hypothetical protein
VREGAGPSNARRELGRQSGSANDCSSVHSIDMNALAQELLGGTPLPALLVAGTAWTADGWDRDPDFPAPNSTTLTAALEINP